MRYYRRKKLSCLIDRGSSMNDELEFNQEIVDSKLRKMIYKIIKRVFDIFVGFIGIIFFIPITLIIKICYMITGDFHKIIFTQERIGKDGKVFKFYKYRSMVPNADEILFKLLKEDKKIAKEYKINKKIKNDPRITKIGKFIRITSIDELPQLINILKGDMSLIGNRPYLPREKDDMGNSFNEIVKTKPGLTGWWQVNLRSRGTFQQRLEMEKYYSRNAGFKLDFKIFIRTFKVVLRKDGAE